MMGLSI